MKKILGLIASLLAIIVILFGAWNHIDTKKADAADLKNHIQRSERRWTEDDWRAIRKRIWSLEDRHTYEKAKMLPEYQELILEREKLELDLKGK